MAGVPRVTIIGDFLSVFLCAAPSQGSHYDALLLAPAVHTRTKKEQGVPLKPDKNDGMDSPANRKYGIGKN